MSINSLTNAAAARRPDFAPLGDVPQGVQDIARASARPLGDAAPPGAPSPGGPSSIDTAFNVLFGYIPTEVVTLYVAVMAALQRADGITPGEWATFWAFLAATPVIVWLVFGAKLKTAGKPLPLNVRAWPFWEMTAASIAYLAWAFALPHSPFSAYGWYSPSLSGIAVLIASTALGLLAPFFQRPLPVQ